MRLMGDLIERIESDERLDRLSKPIVDLVHTFTKPRLVRNWLSGTPLGHPAHPMLTDVPIGTWGAATLLDLLGGKKSQPAADFLVKAGLVAAVPTVASGLNDFGDTYGPETRIGLVHAAANSGAFVLYAASSLARKGRRRGLGRLLGFAAFGSLVAGSYLGGHLSFGKGTNVNRVAWEYGPEEWTAVLPDVDLVDGEHRKVDAAGVGVLLWKVNGKVYAISATCSHMGGPLDEGAFEDGCVTCPWHGSEFRVSDGSIARGPATVPQPVYETRVHDGTIEVKLAA